MHSLLVISLCLCPPSAPQLSAKAQGANARKEKGFALFTLHFTCFRCSPLLPQPTPISHLQLSAKGKGANAKKKKGTNFL